MIVAPIAAVVTIVATTVMVAMIVATITATASKNIAIATEACIASFTGRSKNRSPRAAIFFVGQTTNLSSAPRNPPGIATG
jgi:hypothetical protein